MAATRTAARIVRLAADVIRLLLQMQLILLSVCAISGKFEGFLLCRKCGFEVAKVADIANIHSEMALNRRNASFPGGQNFSLQLFVNPVGRSFELITTSSAKVMNDENAYRADSWFPGFQWTFCLCPQCQMHLGWLFTPVGTDPIKDNPRSFIGLIFDHILHEQEADSIIATPKAYSS